MCLLVTEWDSQHELYEDRSLVLPRRSLMQGRSYGELQGFQTGLSLSGKDSSALNIYGYNVTYFQTVQSKV